jgi:hypothetical protein
MMTSLRCPPGVLDFQLSHKPSVRVGAYAAHQWTTVRCNPFTKRSGRYKQAHAAHLQTMEDLFGDEDAMALRQERVREIQDCYERSVTRSRRMTMKSLGLGSRVRTAFRPTRPSQVVL